MEPVSILMKWCQLLTENHERRIQVACFEQLQVFLLPHPKPHLVLVCALGQGETLHFRTGPFFRLFWSLSSGLTVPASVVCAE